MKPTIQHDLRNLSHRDQLGPLLTKMGLTGKGVEVGTLYGNYASTLLNSWPGHLYCVDPWQNQAKEVYFDGANEIDMNHIWQTVQASVGAHPRCTLMKMFSLNGAGFFKDGELDFVYLDGNHAVDAVREDIAAWWPKVKIGGIVSGHDYNVRYDHETNSDAMTAVAELSEAIEVRVHINWCTSWYFIKTEEADKKFRAACISGELARPVYTNNVLTVQNLAVVIPVAKFDWNLAVKMLTWWKALLAGQPNPYPTVVLYSTELTQEQIDALGDSGLPNLALVEAKGVEERGYFGGTPNAMFRTAIEHVEKVYLDHAMLWVEADATPMRADWVGEIFEEYLFCDRPFMGEILTGGTIAHMTGNGVYHPNWRKLAPSLATLQQQACGWDTLCAGDIVPRAHDCKTIQQIWRPGPFDLRARQALIQPETALFHQCKDGTLIDVLCDAEFLPKIPLAKALAETTYEEQVTKYDGPVGYDSAKAKMQTWPPGPRVEILIVTFARDQDFLQYLVRSIQLYSVGFAGVTIAVPSGEKGMYDWLPRGFKVKYYDDVPGKGMLMHLIQKSRADELCPDAEYILHADADNMFWESFTPRDFLPYDKPILVRERYSECGLRNENRLNWHRTTLKATGIDCPWETMVRHPQIHRRETYKRMREIVEAHTARSFNDYVLDGQNSFPQSFCEFGALGTVACTEFPKKYTMVDYDRQRDGIECGIDPNASWQYIYRKGRDKMVEFWSHGQIGTYQKLMEEIMRGTGPSIIVK